jgi:hypothetical protein
MATKKIKRVVKVKTGNKLYFNVDTQAAIVQFQNEQSLEKKHQIYREQIFPALEKLVENLINIHKFSGLHDTYENLKCDCISFLYETLNKFDNSRGTNAFSYFNIVAKRWLIIKTKQKSTKIKKIISLDDPEALDQEEQRTVEEYSMVPSQDVVLEKETYVLDIIKLLYDIRNRSTTSNELVCINSIITIFEHIDEIDILTKSAVFLYIRELSGLSSKQLTTALQMIKKSYRQLKKEKLSDDSCDILSMF